MKLADGVASLPRTVRVKYQYNDSGGMNGWSTKQQLKRNKIVFERFDGYVSCGEKLDFYVESTNGYGRIGKMWDDVSFNNTQRKENHYLPTNNIKKEIIKLVNKEELLMHLTINNFNSGAIGL